VGSGSLFFLKKKKQKTFYPLGCGFERGSWDFMASPPWEPAIRLSGEAMNKNFLLLFFKKEDSACPLPGF
jgi:hypothetical protein